MTSYKALIILTVIFDIICCIGALKDCKKKLAKSGLDSKRGIYNFMYIEHFKNLNEFIIDVQQKTHETLEEDDIKSLYSPLYTKTKNYRNKEATHIDTPEEFCRSIAIQEINKNVAETRKKIRKEEKNVAKTRKKIRKAKKKMVGLSKKIKSLEMHMCHYVTEIANTNKKITEIKDERTNFGMENLKMEDDIAKKEDDIAKMNKEITDWTNEIMQVELKVHGLKFEKECTDQILAFRCDHNDKVFTYDKDNQNKNLITTYDIIKDDSSFKKTIGTIINFMRKSKYGKYALEYFKYLKEIVNEDKNYGQFTISKICKELEKYSRIRRR